jgi:Uma2 family endonuclease
MRQANVRFTYHDYLLLPEDKRYEILEGDMVVVLAPNTAHQRILGNLLSALFNHVRQHKLGEVFCAPYDVVLSEENVVQPDIIFVRSEHIGIIGTENIQGAPDLVVEILSPGTKSRDLIIKRKIYAKYGITEYWIVDPIEKTLEVLIWAEEGYRSAGIYPYSAVVESLLLPDFRVPLAEIFP